MSLDGYTNTSLNLEGFVPVWGESVNVSFYPDQSDLYAMIDETEYGDTHHEIAEEKIGVYVPAPSCKKNDMFKMGGDSIEHFYLGSISVIGLFILFRMLQRS